MSQQYPPDNNGQQWNTPQQPPYYPQQPPYQQFPQQQPPTYYPQQQPLYQQPPVFPSQLPPMQQPQQPQKKQRKSIKQQWNSGPTGKCGVIFAVFILLLVVGLCSGIMNAATKGSQSADTPTPQTAAQGVPVKQTTPAPTVKPTPTARPKPTATPEPTQSPAQVETAYKAGTTDTTVATLDKDGAADMGNDVHFTCTIVAFVKDSSGTTAGANVTDASGSFVQVIFTPGTDITQINTQDTIEVWGNDQGVSSGTNAFGATVQEVVIQASYMADQTTGYKADS